MTDQRTRSSDDNEKILAHVIRQGPKIASPDEAAAKFADLEARIASGSRLETLVKSGDVRNLLEGIADHSPYLWTLIRNDPERLERILSSTPDAFIEASLETARRLCSASDEEEEVMVALRAMKQEIHLAIAMADIAGAWDVLDVTAALTRMADTAVSLALAFLLREAARRGKLNLPEPEDPEKGCGVVVLALGKHGAGELNYSSDVDLVVFFDPDSSALAEPGEAGQLFVRITRALVKILQERTGDGYVLRVDLRLRPDPGSTSVAISLPAAFGYYETSGQNWERAAFIKARAIAGDVAIGEQFLNELTPFIWRKYFDYAAIADIHAMKRQIHAVRGYASIAVAGHDVKLGRGGIREVEFFVQTQQLIFGGRRPQLRGRRTLDMLAELHNDGWVTEDAVEELGAGYRFLREIEHRLQMRNDEQTQRLPADDTAVDLFAKFCGFDSMAGFSAAITKHFSAIEKHYARLFEDAPGLASESGSLVFAGGEDDPETLETLSRMGFQNPERASDVVRGWHFGRRAATQSARAREVLTELVPSLLEAFAGSSDPDAALSSFDEALARMPAAIELFTILRSNESVRELFGDILGSAPSLAQVVAQRPHVLDAAIDPDLLQASRDAGIYSARAGRILETAGTTEEFLDNIRDMALEETFLIGVRTLSGMIGPYEAGHSYSWLAEALLRAAVTHVHERFAEDHGHVPGGACIIIGLGRLGSLEMTATSDLDLILLYDFDEEHPESDGRRSLHASQYYARLTQRILSALTVSTRRGPLYEIDMRLRPSGRQGPVATKIASFAEYQSREAETWEHMALCRARVVAGDPALAGRAAKIVAHTLSTERDEDSLRKSVGDMRRLIAREKGESDIWDLKLCMGGLLDLEFIAQYLVLRFAADHPEIMQTETVEVLRTAGNLELLSASDAGMLADAHTLYSSVIQILRLAIDGPFDPEKTSLGVLKRIADCANLPDFRSAEAELATTRAAVRNLFDRMFPD